MSAYELNHECANTHQNNDPYFIIYLASSNCKLQKQRQKLSVAVLVQNVQNTKLLLFHTLKSDLIHVMFVSVSH